MCKLYVFPMCIKINKCLPKILLQCYCCSGIFGLLSISICPPKHSCPGQAQGRNSKELFPHTMIPHLPHPTGTWQGLSHVFSLRGHFKCTHLRVGLLTLLHSETHSYSSWMDPNLKSFLLFQFKRTQKFRNIVLASVWWIRGETLTSPLLCVLPNHSLCHEILTVLRGDVQWWRKLPAGRAWSAQTRRELAAGSLEKGMQKSECLSLAGILTNFVNLPSFPGTCLFNSASDDKLLPPDPQPTLYMACGLITIMWNKWP